MAIIKKTTQQRVEVAKQKSVDALSIFTSTIEALRRANEELASAREDDMAQIEQLQANADDAEEQMRNNEQLIYKVRNIIS